MTRLQTCPPGTFSWVDLNAHDMQAAIAFYGSLFGWAADPQDTGGGPPYALFRHDGDVVAGIGEMSEEMKSQGVPPTWNSYVTVADADATAARAEALGGTVRVPVMDVMSAGRMAFLVDPVGASLAIWEPGDMQGAEKFNVPVSLAWNEHATPDVETSRAFYEGLFDWEITKVDGPAPSETVGIENAGRPNGHMLQMTEAWEGIPPHWSVYFAVEDIDATCKQVPALGGDVRVGPFDIPPGRIAVVADPQGATFYVIQLAGPAD